MNPTAVASLRRWPNAAAWLIPVLLYVGLVIPIGIQQREEVNPDGIIYVRKAQFLLQGHFWDSVSGYWPPAISWCIALVLKIVPSANPLYVMHGVQEFFGATWVAACCAFLAVILPNRPTWRVLGGIAIVLAALKLAVEWMAPDLLLGTMMMAYLAVVARTHWTHRDRTPFIAGLWMGLGYLCKSYAMPFFVLHYPFTLAYRWWTNRHEESWKQQLRPLLIGIIGFAIPAAPWVGVMSYKYGKFTISMVYHHNHLNVAPESYLRRSPDFTVVPPDPYLCIWEGLDPGPRKDWSALSSRKFFRYQIHIATEHIKLIIGEIRRFDGIGLSLLALVAAFWPWRRFIGGTGLSAIPAWITLTCVIYSLGFLAVAFETRYIIPIYLPLVIAVLLRIWKELTESRLPGADWKWEAVPLAFMAAFIAMAAYGVREFFIDSPPPPIAMKVADALRNANLIRLFTSSDNNRGMDVAYFLNQKTVLIPFSDDRSKPLFAELAAARVEEILLWKDNRHEDADNKSTKLSLLLRRNKAWTRVKVIRVDSARRVEVYLHQKRQRPATQASAASMPSTAVSP